MGILDFEPQKMEALKARIARERKKGRENPQAENRSVNQNNSSSAFCQTSHDSQEKTATPSFSSFDKGGQGGFLGRSQSQSTGKEMPSRPSRSLHSDSRVNPAEGFEIPLGLLYAIGGLVLFLIGLLIASFFFQEVPVIIY